MEPKFRFWHSERKQMLSVVSLKWDSGRTLAYGIEGIGGRVGCDPISPLMQYTELIDDSGDNPIYVCQGDIVIMHQFLFDGDEVEQELTGVIGHGDYGLTLERIKNKHFQEHTGYEPGEGSEPLDYFYGLHEDSWKVIGNRYSTPELLQEDK